MHIARLRLLGFKSFVEPTELLIERGLTGVVGPNGCGKSNLLEALRWVMGEASYKSMRASTMEDVIFSGTTSRPGRNWAEVTIFVDNSARQAPAEFNDSDELEVTRRIERELGSAYRINGTEARARDVKILFEDAATGARSPSLVRQGQIGEIVNAKPEQRRRILEDAAGVAGLHSRRHEAELRLKAAETNLARLNDVLGQLAGQVESLKRQARQARRYKELSGEIRTSEALLLHLAWTAAQADVDYTEAMLADTLSRVAEAAQQEAVALREEADSAEALDPLREEEATARRHHRAAQDRAGHVREGGRAPGPTPARAGRPRRRSSRATSSARTSWSREAHEIVARLAEEDEALAATAESEAVGRGRSARQTHRWHRGAGGGRGEAGQCDASRVRSAGPAPEPGGGASRAQRADREAEPAGRGAGSAGARGRGQGARRGEARCHRGERAATAARHRRDRSADDRGGGTRPRSRRRGEAQAGGERNGTLQGRAAHDGSRDAVQAAEARPRGRTAADRRSVARAVGLRDGAGRGARRRPRCAGRRGSADALAPHRHGARRSGAAARGTAADRHGRGAAGTDAAAEADRHRGACRRQAAAIGAEAGTAAGIARGRPVAMGRVRCRGARADGCRPAAGRAQSPWRDRRDGRRPHATRRRIWPRRSARRPSCIAWPRPRSAACASSGATRNPNWRVCARR